MYHNLSKCVKDGVIGCILSVATWLWQTPALMSRNIQTSEFALAFGRAPKLLKFPGVMRAREKYLQYKGDPVKVGYTDWERVMQWVKEEGNGGATMGNNRGGSTRSW